MRRLATILCAATLAGSALSASELGTAWELGSQGEIYRLYSGRVSDLLPDEDLPGDHEVLALYIEHPDGTIESQLVPGTESLEAERESVLLLEEETGSLFLAWETRVGWIHSQLLLARWHEGSWSEPFTLASGPFSLRASPRLGFTRSEVHRLEDDGTVTAHYRTILHITWWEATDQGRQSFYRPIVLFDGEVAGQGEPFDLEELVGAEPADDSQAGGELYETSWLLPGADASSHVSVFADPETQTISSVFVRPLPGELGQVADRARAQIIEIGLVDPDLDRAELASRARAQIIEIGFRFDSIILDVLADAVDRVISSAAPDDPLEVIADRARAQIIEVGHQAMSHQMLSASAQPPPTTIVEVGTDLDSQLVELRVASSRPAPETASAPSRVFASGDGTELLLAWADDGTVSYLTSDGDGWQPLATIVLGGDIDLARAYEMLQRLIRR